MRLLKSGELERRAHDAIEVLADCTVCPRQCHADRREGDSLSKYGPPSPPAPLPLAGEGNGGAAPLSLAGEGSCETAARPRSVCRTGRAALVSSAFPHHGEEDCLRGWNGSGTIFFSQCNLRCVFCQNFDISWQGHGQPVTAEQLADLMLALQDQGCHNINLVTPSHVVPQILEGLVVAAGRGLTLPLVYNTGGYDRVETLRWLDGVIDIYMPDFKFWSPATARELAHAADYPEVARAAIKEMHRQVGDLVLDEHGLACRGLLVRHLVMPGGLKETHQILRFLAREISPETFVNIMPQYRPAGLAARHPAIARPLRQQEFAEAVAIAREEGLRRFASG